MFLLVHTVWNRDDYFLSFFSIFHVRVKPCKRQCKLLWCGVWHSVFRLNREVQVLILGHELTTAFMLSFMSQNQTSFSFPGVFSTASVPQAEFEHEGSEIDHGLNDIPPTDSSWSSNTKSQTELEEINPSMASMSLTTTPIGVLLPVCLLAVFLSCVVCVYHWHSVRERRLDLEDERKRRSRIVSDFDTGCVLRTLKPVDKVNTNLNLSSFLLGRLSTLCFSHTASLYD